MEGSYGLGRSGCYKRFSKTLGTGLYPLMHKDFLDKLVEHGNGQLVEVLVLINQSDKTISVLFAVSYTHLDVYKRQGKWNAVGGAVVASVCPSPFSPVNI